MTSPSKVMFKQKYFPSVPPSVSALTKTRSYKHDPTFLDALNFYFHMDILVHAGKAGVKGNCARLYSP